MKIDFIKKVFGFSIVGVIVTLFSIFLLFLFLKVIKINLYVGYVLSYFISISLSYFLNSTYIFKAQNKTIKQAVIYFMVYIISMIIGLLLLRIAKLIFPYLDKFYLSLMVIPITFIWNFFFSNILFKTINIQWNNEK